MHTHTDSNMQCKGHLQQLEEVRGTFVGRGDAEILLDCVFLANLACRALVNAHASTN